VPRPRGKRRKTAALTSGGDDVSALSESQRVERRERNREHAKKSRIRKKFLLESLLEQVADLRTANAALRRAIREVAPADAHDVLAACGTAESSLLTPGTPASAAPASTQLV